MAARFSSAAIFHALLYLTATIIGADMLEPAEKAGYDTDLILDLARTWRPRDLVTNAGLT